MQMVRAIYRACALAGAESPHDNVTLKIYYRGMLEQDSDALNTGVVPPDIGDDPTPVVLVIPGINVGPESYAWLAERLAAAGYVAVTYSHIAEEMPGYVSLTPGLEIAALAPAEYGKRPSATALGAIFQTLENLNANGLLAGCLATDRVVLVGHSAGGSVALCNANRDWFPQICGAASYGAHAAASTVLGYDEGTILSLPGDVPLLLMAGTRDGVIAASAHRYGDEPGDPLERVHATFDQGIASDRGDCFLVEVEGGNHFSFAYPHSEATGRGFLDWDETADGTAIRDCSAAVLQSFGRFAVGQDPDGMDNLNTNSLTASVKRR